MLVDLGRNDLGRVCDPGLGDRGRVRGGRALLATSCTSCPPSSASSAEGHERSGRRWPRRSRPARCPAPPNRGRWRSSSDLEPTRRGLYGGVVGYLDFGGDLDTAIAIRTAVLRDGHAYVQAGAGIVADCDPDTEYQESVNKAAVVLRAISLAGTLRPAGPGGEDATVDEFARTAGEPA